MADAKLEIILTARDMSAKALTAFQGRIGVITRSVFSLQGAIGALAGVGGFGALAKSALGTAASFEKMQIKLDALTGGQGRKTLEEINRWAVDMPVNTLEAVDAFAMMQAMGLDPTIEKMQTLVDVSSIFGEDTMPRVARAMGQMQTLGKVTAEQLNSMAEAGINARKYLTEAFGMTVEELQKSKISIDRIVDAIWKGLDADYSGAAKASMKSWNGLVTTFKSQWTEMERQVMNAGVFDALKEQMDGVNQKFSAWVATNEDLIAQRVPEYVDGVTRSVGAMFDKLQVGVKIYRALPDEIVGAAGAGIVGRVLFGGWGPAKILSVLYMVNEGLAVFNADLGKFAESYGGAVEAFERIGEVLSGKRHWNTGALQGQEKTYYKIPEQEIPAYIDVTPAKTPAPAKTPTTAAKPTRYTGGDLDDFWRFQAVERYEVISRHLQMEIDAEQRAADAKALLWTEYSGGWEAQARERYEVQSRGLDALVEAERSAFAHLAELSERTFDAMQENFSGLFYDAITGELSSLRDYASAIFDSILKAWSDMMGQMAAQALFGQSGAGGWFQALLGSGSGALVGGGGTTAMFMHSGGTVGRDGVARQMPAWMFHGAPRLHKGLRSNEFPAILERGEQVIPKSGGDGATNVNITIHAVDAKSVQELLTNNKGLLTGLVGAEMMRNGALRSSVRMAAR